MLYYLQVWTHAMIQPLLPQTFVLRQRISNLRIFKYEPSLAICALLLLLAAVDYVAALSEDIERTICALT